MSVQTSQLERARRFLLRAVELSREGMDSGCGGPFGAIVVRGERIVGAGCNRVLKDNDPTAHAEVVAIRAAGAMLGTFSLAGCELFASAEPCPMCLAAAYWARVDRVWYANTIEQAQQIGFDDSNFYHELAKPIEKRRLEQIHVDMPEAWEVFAAWQAKADKTPY